MPGGRIEIHPAALAELKSAVEWYLERSEPAADEFVSEVDRAIALVIESPRRWPVGEYNTRRFVCSGFLTQSLTGKKIRAYKFSRLLTDTAAPDTGRNGCSG